MFGDVHEAHAHLVCFTSEPPESRCPGQAPGHNRSIHGDGEASLASVSVLCVRLAPGARLFPRRSPCGLLCAHRGLLTAVSASCPCPCRASRGPGAVALCGAVLCRANVAVTMACLPAGPDRELQTVRRTMIDFLQNHTDGDRPPACPPLDPARCVLVCKVNVRT